MQQTVTDVTLVTVTETNNKNTHTAKMSRLSRSYKKQPS